MKKETAVLPEVEFHKFTHELINPLTICNGYLEILSKKINPKEEKYLQIIQKEIDRSLNIINDYKQNKFINLILEEFDLTYLLEEVQKTLNSLFQEHHSKIFFEEEQEYYIIGDYDKLKQVFINLLKNAYEAKSKDNLLVVIKMISYPTYYQIWIIDNGIGMDNEELRSIKKEYYTTKEYGTGLGTSYCDEIIRKHGGNLFYQSRKEIGTRVIITLPKKKSPKTFNNSNCY